MEPDKGHPPSAQNPYPKNLDAAFPYLEGLEAPMSVGSLTLIDCPQQVAGDFHRGLRERASDRP